MTLAHIIHAQSEDSTRLGGKAAALARLGRAGFSVPGWFVVAPEAMRASLSEAQANALAQAGTSDEAQAALEKLTPAPQVQKEIVASLAALTGDEAGGGRRLVAVRSSALGEDGSEHSFAGQLDSLLDVAPEEVCAAVAQVWRSGFGPRVYAYRRERNLALPPPAPAVLVQRMVRAEAAGVAFSRDPVSGRRSVAVVEAVAGLADKLVSGEEAGDTYRIGRDGAILERIVQTPEAAVLADEQARAVADLARRVEAAAGRAQDVEWAMEGGALYLLQARPITGLEGLPDPDGSLRLWDNSNIIESYGGMTTPLTYAFARRAYEEVYQEFCRILGVPERTIRAHPDVFAAMIGLVQGRIYYNLLNWYRVLAMLPGFKSNRGFMEQMMGVRDALPEEIVTELAAAGRGARLADRVALVKATLGLVGAYFGLEGRKQRFTARLRGALGDESPDLAALTADELLAYYRRLDRELLHHWDAPLVNDFFAMIFFGTLRRLVEAWCGDAGHGNPGALHNDLLVGEGGMISAEPAERVAEMARLVAEAGRPELVALLQRGTAREIEAALREIPALERAYREYLAKFGERCLNELKLESATLHDDPLPLLRSVGQVAAAQGASAGRMEAVRESPAEVRRRAEERAEQATAGKPLRRWVFGWVLRNARERVRDRENLRFERTRVFGRARQIFRAFGERLVGAGRLGEGRDVFYLEPQEIFGFVEGTATTSDLAGLAALRKAEFARYATQTPPTRRFTTRGMVHQGNTFQGDASAEKPHVVEGDAMHGLGCSPGVVRGRVRVVRDPLTAELQPGDIIAAEHTDPSWILILPLAGGLLVERGSLLSHAAIVSRELGVPGIVGLAGVTQWLADGDVVEMDGGTGIVRRVEAATGA